MLQQMGHRFSCIQVLAMRLKCLVGLLTTETAHALAHFSGSSRLKILGWSEGGSFLGGMDRADITRFMGLLSDAGSALLQLDIGRKFQVQHVAGGLNVWMRGADDSWNTV
ncbi:hypothetical protein BKA70DRAFT_1356275 [Coprinopsis sp. MPI-PUGE-AT-0042]|nr:hypothetical protein BKA70DRAFT_1356275 [Coprinopsis sp. MPI-PUGE-AT-0042]